MKSIFQLIPLLVLSSTTLKVGHSDAAPVNLNVKNGLLSRWMGKASSPKSSDSTATSREQSSSSSGSSSKGKVSLDLTGKYHCLVAGPAQQDDVVGAPIPLFQIGKVQRGWSPPSLTLSVKYNFSQAWYGATRLLTNLAWSYRTTADLERATRESSPFSVNLQAEKGLLEQDDDDYAVEVGVALKSFNQDPPTLSLRWEPQCKQVSVAAPLHRRLQVAWRSIFPTARQSDSNAHSFFSHSSPVQQEQQQQQDWWIPTLKINTAGRLAADNRVGFRVNDKRNVGIRLLFSHQLGWNAVFGSEVMNDHIGTVMRLEVTGTEDGKSISTLTMQSVLECPRASTQFIVSHEQVHTH